MQNEALLAKIFFVFMCTWLVLMAVSVYLFWLNKDTVFKRKWLPRFVIFVGVLFVGFSSTMMLVQSPTLWDLGVCIAMIPIVVLISYLNIRFIRFCDTCGATILPNNPFMRTRYCPRCGAGLHGSTPPDPPSSD